MREQTLLMLTIIVAKKPPSCYYYLGGTEDLDEKLLFRSGFIDMFFISLLYKVLKNHKFACGLGSVVLFLNHLLVRARVLFSKVRLRNKVTYGGWSSFIVRTSVKVFYWGANGVKKNISQLYLYADKNFKYILRLHLKRLLIKRG